MSEPAAPAPRGYRWVAVARAPAAVAEVIVTAPKPRSRTVSPAPVAEAPTPASPTPAASRPERPAAVPTKAEIEEAAHLEITHPYHAQRFLERRGDVVFFEGRHCRVNGGPQLEGNELIDHAREAFVRDHDLATRRKASA